MKSNEMEVGLFPPYVLTYNRLKALFDADPELSFGDLIDEDRSATIYSSNKHKLEALEQALDFETFAKLGLTLRLAYTEPTSVQADFINDLFRGNPHFSRAYVTYDAMSGEEITICYFKDETLQYPADNRFVPGGYNTTLAEQLVRELLKADARHLPFVTEPKCEVLPPTTPVEDICEQCEFSNEN